MEMGGKYFPGSRSCTRKDGALANGVLYTNVRVDYQDNNKDN